MMKIGKNMKRLVVAFLLAGMICQNISMTAFAETMHAAETSGEMRIPEDNEGVSKALVAYILYLLEAAPSVDDEAVFKDLDDVYEAEWYADAVAWAYKCDVVPPNIYTKKFEPNRVVSIEEFFAILYRYSSYKGYDCSATSDLSGFEDVDAVSADAVAAMKWAVGLGIFNGVDDEGIRYLLPNERCTVGDLKESLKRYIACYHGDILDEEMNDLIKVPADAPVLFNNGDIAAGKINGDYGQITWAISKEGKLTVTGSGDLRADNSNQRAPWCLSRYREHIVSAEINVKNMTDISGLFYQCSNIKDIDLSELDTSQVTDMSSMFSGCESLETLDISNFDTSQVTNMESMFSGCGSLEYLDLSSFDMSQVVVTDIASMFNDCNRLEEMETPINCGERILLPYQFYMPNGNVIDFLPQDASSSYKITKEPMRIPEDNEYVSKALVVYSLYMLEGEPSVDDLRVLTEVMDVYYDWYTNAVAWAYNHGIVTADHRNCLNPNGVVSIEEFFKILYRYTAYKDYDYSVTSDFSEFEDVDAVSAGAVAAMKWAVGSELFNGVDDEGIRYLLPSEIYTVKDLKESLMRYTGLYDEGISDQEMENLIKIPADVPEISNRATIADGKINGDYGQITWVISNEGKLTVTGSGNWRSDSSNLRAPWCLSRYRDRIVSAEINVENMTDISGLFYQCSNIKDIDVSGLDTSQVTDMSSMFSGCESLETLDISNFDTIQVTDMSAMFSGCESLETLDISNFDTSQVTNMEAMFSGCGSLEYLDLSSFDMSQVVVTDIASMFNDCNRLEEIETPINCGERILLPYQFYMPNGDDIDFLPQNASSSYKITKELPEIEPTLDPTPTATVTEMPEITGTPEIIETPGVTSDVTKVFLDVYNDWYTSYVQYVFDNNLMTGIKGTDDFRPNANITKAQVAQVLYNMEDQPKVTNKAVFKDLTDVYEVEWYANAVAWAYDTGVVTGDLNAKKFFPNADVTREQLALMMYRYAKYEGYDTYKTSSDLADLKNADKVADWALEGVKWAVGAGLISGVETDGVKDLAPQGNASRAQMAAILQRFCQNIYE